MKRLIFLILIFLNTMYINVGINTILANNIDTIFASDSNTILVSDNMYNKPNNNIYDKTNNNTINKTNTNIISNNTFNQQTNNTLGEVKAIYFSPSSKCEELIVSYLNNARDNVDIIIYSITSENIVRALKNAKDNNIGIRVIADRTQSKGKNSLVDEIISYGIPVRISKKHKIEHNKVSIIDNRFVITGSYNYTNNALNHNSENCILIEDYEHLFKERFEYLWRLYD